MVNENSFLKLKLHSSSSNLCVFTYSGDVSECQPLKLPLGVCSYVDSQGWGQTGGEKWEMFKGKDEGKGRNKK